MQGVAIWIAVATVATAIVWVGSSWLEQSSEQLAASYGLPAVIQGSIIAAVGSSFPELSSAVIATLLHGEFDLGVGAIVGSAIFNILVIPGISGLYGGVSANRDIAHKEVLFYVVAIATLMVTFSLSVIYRPAAVDGVTAGTVTRGLALVPLVTYAVYLFIQYQDAAAQDAAEEPADDAPPVWRQWLLLGASLVVIAVGVELLVKAALGLGEAFGTPSFLWGVTVVAAGTSLPDAFVTVRAARDGRGVTGLANVFGSNTFDLLVAVPVGVLLAGATVINYSAALPLMGFLAVATLLVFVFVRTDLEVTRRESTVLLVVYAAFVIWMVLETVGAVTLLPVG